jgi:ribonuclease Z
VHHEPVSPAVAYRVDTPDGAVVISGDTRVCDEVAESSEGTNVLVHEIVRASGYDGEIVVSRDLTTVSF